MADRVRQFPLNLWAVFFLIQTGRGAALDQITPDECEDVLRWLDDLSRDAPFIIKTTEAPPFRRVARQAGRVSPFAVNDGNGFVFIDHIGQICPSGFLPMPCGNVRDVDLIDVYRHHETFVRLRDANALTGRCGRCEFRTVCGGSRSRAFAATGDAFATDPLCAYEPRTVANASLAATHH
jgi:radical SAM protein with 4Fe4S-binding SPASM domain